MTGRAEVDRKFKTYIENHIQRYPDYLKDYYYSKSRLTIRTMATYINHICAFLDSIQKPIENINKSDIDRFFNKLEYGDKELSKSHLATKYSALRSFFEFLCDANIITVNPIEKCERVKVTQIKEGRTDYLTESEMQTYLENVRCGIRLNNWERDLPVGQRERDLAIITLFLYTGMRCSALIELSMADLDFDEKSICIITKGQKEQIFRNLDIWFDKYLIPWLNCRDKYYNKYNNDAVFLSKQGKRMSVSAVYDTVLRYTYAIPKKITPHKLRATFATSLYNKGVDILTISHALGHANLDTTTTYLRGYEDKSQITTGIMSGLIN